MLPEKIVGIALAGHPRESFPSADMQIPKLFFWVECGPGFSSKHELCGQRLQTGCPLTSAGLQIDR